ncbi:hypothetical protein RR46_03909 [Papilio xuthus]|uniref:Chitin-binding type-2 domain-containing protein n=1 Tax=Papilio xuthus TaxID=66420 RepID=A0A194Q3F4_PAPXU|nr:hypothetical protein RR46_03909 [Papilio xuthus]
MYEGVQKSYQGKAKCSWARTNGLYCGQTTADTEGTRAATARARLHAGKRHLGSVCNDLQRATKAASSAAAAAAAAPTRGTSPTKLSVPAHSHLSPIIRRVDNSGSNDIPRRCLEMTTSELPCAGVGEDRLLPHPDDCELFYYCVGDVAICRQCPSGLHFSPTHHVCERAARAGCVSARASHPDQE